MLDKNVYIFLDKIRNMYRTGPYITRVTKSQHEHIHFIIKKQKVNFKRDRREIP